MTNRFDLEVWEKRLRNAENKRDECMSSWDGIIPWIARCEICDRELKFRSKDKSTSIHFDHRKGGEEKIKGSPSNWLQYHKRNSENERIWTECDFGILCNRCNSFLPTKNREERVNNVIRYMQKSRRDLPRAMEER